MNYYKPLIFDTFYHVYNHGNNQDNIFLDENNYPFFLEKIMKYLFPVMDIYCYNLLKNHFHLLIKVKTENEIKLQSELSCTEKKVPFRMLDVSKQFSDLFNSYSKSINKKYSRRGSLFTENFKRVEIKTDNKFSQLIGYIHTNAQHHKMVDDFRDWTHNSYNQILNENNSFVKSNEVLKWFGNIDEYVKFHLDFSKSIKQDHRWIEKF